MRLCKFLRVGVRAIAFFAVTVSYWTCMELESLLRRQQRRSDLIKKWVPRWAGMSLRLYGIQVDASGPFAEEGKLYPASASSGVGRVFVMNHRSGLDIPILLTIAETHVISRHDLATWPILGKAARRVGTLFVDRESRRSGATVLKQVARALAAGEGVAMFPEGTSHVGDQVHEFRPGAFNAARRAGAEVVPLGIAYDNDAAYYHNESFASHFKRVAGIRRQRVSVVIGQPLVDNGISSVEMKVIARQRVQGLVDGSRAQLEKRK